MPDTSGVGIILLFNFELFPLPKCPSDSEDVRWCWHTAGELLFQYIGLQLSIFNFVNFSPVILPEMEDCTCQHWTAVATFHAIQQAICSSVSSANVCTKLCIICGKVLIKMTNSMHSRILPCGITLCTISHVVYNQPGRLVSSLRLFICCYLSEESLVWYRSKNQIEVGKIVLDLTGSDVVGVTICWFVMLPGFALPLVHS